MKRQVTKLQTQPADLQTHNNHDPGLVEDFNLLYKAKADHTLIHGRIQNCCHKEAMPSNLIFQELPYLQISVATAGTFQGNNLTVACMVGVL